MRPQPRRVPPPPRFRLGPQRSASAPSSPPCLSFLDYLVQCKVLSRGAAAGSRAADDGLLAWSGTLGVLLGYLDRPAVDRILRHQTRSGLEFEDVAVAIGLLTSEQRAEIDDLHQRLHITLTEISCALTHLEPEAVGDHLRAFRHAASGIAKAPSTRLCPEVPDLAGG